MCLLKSLNRVSRVENRILEEAREAIQGELEEKTKECMEKVKRSVLESLPGARSFSSTGSLDLSKKYASMPAADVVLEVLSNARQVFCPKMAKVGINLCYKMFRCSSSSFPSDVSAR